MLHWNSGSARRIAAMAVVAIGMGLTATAGVSAAAPTPTPYAAAPVMVAGALTTAEADGLLYMREEEKLARDVYQTLAAKWNVATFGNIAQSEATHMESVRILLERYGLADPAAGKAVGVFTNPALQSLYDKLVADGSRSLEAAFRVGAAIEEIDLLDLDKHVAETDQSDIQWVYDNLLRGSRNHLRSFTAWLGQMGVTYQPQYLSATVYQQIVTNQTERGGRWR